MPGNDLSVSLRLPAPLGGEPRCLGPHSFLASPVVAVSPLNGRQLWRPYGKMADTMNGVPTGTHTLFLLPTAYSLLPRRPGTLTVASCLLPDPSPPFPGTLTNAYCLLPNASNA